MKTIPLRPYILPVIVVLLGVVAGAPAANNQILTWNNLGMHCMDSDYSVFSILPPYNTIEAQLIVNGRLITNGAGYSVTYQAVADPDGSFNSTAMGKGNFYDYSGALYGATPPDEAGLVGWAMPGTNNVPQGMLFEQTNHPAAGVASKVNWWRAEGIPISPYDDAHHKNPYPLMRVIAWNGSTAIATNDVVLPVSDEMDCRACHASGSANDARPAAGWVWDALPERDFRLNILRLHDEQQFAQHGELYQAALAARGFPPEGLYRSVVAYNKPVLCAACHASEALGAPSYGTIPPLTTSIHSRHANVLDPETHVVLDSSASRNACYRCHPGSATKCLRGAMGAAIAADGSMSMQCQSCHGNMSTVGASTRVGWFMEPNCQSCHSGTAVHNNGQIRYTSVFTDTNGTVRVAATNTFATQPDTPAAGISLFRFSAGHGGLQCEACHGSTHAEFPATHRNDNLRNISLQGHAGVMVECGACHVSTPNTVAGGPHGMHPVDQSWVNRHPDLFETGAITRGQCQTCHGTDYRGTVLSRAQNNRSLSAYNGTKTFFRGATIGCYTCHQGPYSGDENFAAAPTVNNVVTNTSNDLSVAMSLPATGSGLSYQIVSQPTNGTVGLSNNVATYFPDPGFVGTDRFTFTVYNGSKNSNLGTGTVAVVQGSYSLGVSPRVPPSYPAGWPAAFGAFTSVTNSTAPVTFDWNFGDATPHATNQFAAHAFSTPGTYNWTLTATLSSAAVVKTGSIQIGSSVVLTPSVSGGLAVGNWSGSIADVVVEQSQVVGPLAQWLPATNLVALTTNGFMAPIVPGANQFFRLRQVQ